MNTPAPAPTPIPLSAREIDLIVIHCSATPQGQHFTVYDIDKWHAARGFHRGAAAVRRFNPLLGYIGYHWVIDNAGQVFSGRHVDEIGAHVADHNAHSLGICMVGMNRFAMSQWDALRGLVASVRTAYPGAQICGHRDLSPDLNGDGVIQKNEWLKECPTFDVGSWVARGMQPAPENVIKD